jgi:putative DNA primase/helicase
MTVIDLIERAEETSPPFSEEALALEFAKAHAGKLRYVAAWGKWLFWDGKRWRFDETREVFSQARAICRRAANILNKPARAKAIATAKTRAAVVSLVSEDRRLVATADQWDVDPWLLNTPGGVVDLRTGIMRPHSADDYMTKITEVAPGGDCPRFKKFLLRISDGVTELVKYLQRMLGYSLTGVTIGHLRDIAMRA